MDYESNPFQNLYVTERASPDEFVHLFTPFLVTHTQELFHQTNVILQGSQGCGKTTLLSLLKPDIRISYFNSNIHFPLSDSDSNFITAGINLVRSDAIGFGQRPFVNKELNDDTHLFPLYYADFINYWLLYDLFCNLNKYSDYPNVFGKLVNKNQFENFTLKLISLDCWFGFLSDCKSFDEVVQKISWRILQYRQFNQFNIAKLPKSIHNTKTNIGEPLSKTFQTLLATNAVNKDSRFLVRIDQLESVMEADELRPLLRNEYRAIINKALSTRDANVAYKIGVRTYAWKKNLRIFRTETNLEDKRDYTIINFDNLLRREENAKTWLFPEFAKRVFKRRVVFFNKAIQKYSADKLFSNVFTTKNDPHDIASRYCSLTKNINHALSLDASLSDEWISFLTQIFQKDPLSAKLASAWLLQGKDSERTKNMPSEKIFEQITPWWFKERKAQALMQLAANCSQNMFWGGGEQILALSCGSILIFLSICQSIWDAFLRSERCKIDSQKTNPFNSGISIEIQNIGIFSASKYWFNKITELPNGHVRRRFIQFLARLFRNRLLNDKKMSYPGHNGFSLSQEDLDRNPEVYYFLKDCVDYGVLFEFSHTTKKQLREQRIKWYLNPIYSPYFRIHEKRIKEPLYTTCQEIDTLIKSAQSDIEVSDFKNFVTHNHKKANNLRPSLFDV